MRAHIEVDGLPEVRAAIRRLGLAAQRTREAREEIGEEMLRRTASRFASGVGPDGKRWKKSRRSSSGGQTLDDTGMLKSRVAYDATGTEDLDLYSWDKRARVHQLGLTIEPSGGRDYLTIPLRAKGGAYEHPAKRGAHRPGRDGRSAAHFEDGTFVARVRGRLYIFQRTDHGVRALFLLVRSVTMPARPFLGFSNDDLAMARQTFADFFGDAFTGGTNA